MILAIVGPTGVGKTKLSIALAKKYHAVIINFDSMQVYETLNIGTAKVTAKEMEGVPHYLLSFIPLTKNYTVFDYQKDARKMLDHFLKEKKNIILVGGTGLYLKALLYDYRFEKEEDAIFDFSSFSNEELVAEIKSYGEEELPHVHNRKRLERMLQKLKQGQSIAKEGNRLLYETTFLGLEAPRELLYPKIDGRVDQMFLSGLIEEVESVKGYFPVSKALQSGIGYKEFLPYYEGEYDLDAVKQMIKINSRHYAKRQFTFFRNQFPVTWFSTSFSNFDKTIEEVIAFIEKDT